MSNAELFHVLADENYGSRKRLMAILHALNKRLTFDVLRQQRLPAIWCANDAKSCYDRIVHSVASLCMRRCGVPAGPCHSMFRTIQSMKHHIRTVHGVSATSFDGTQNAIPPQGIGQGNGADPAIWAVVSTPILNMLRAAGHGVKLVSSISGSSTHFVAYVFVDDCDMCETATSCEMPLDALLGNMQASLNLWEGSLRATGGALVPEKTHWYLIAFKWDSHGKFTYCSPDDAPASLSVRDAAGNITEIERLSVQRAERTLGVRLAPDGNNKAEFHFRLAAAQTWSDKVHSARLSHPLTWLSLTTSALKTQEYPLPATTFSPAECRQIMGKLLHRGLPACGIARTFPRALVHAPLCY